MDEKDRQLGLAVLRHVLVGTTINGVGFAWTVQFRFGRGSCVQTSSAWAVYPTRPDMLPDREEDVPQAAGQEQYRVLLTLLDQVVTSVDLGETHPHLLLTLANGQVLFISGNTDPYESWECVRNDGSGDEFWLVVATPGGGLAIWAPPEFSA